LAFTFTEEAKAIPKFAFATTRLRCLFKKTPKIYESRAISTKCGGKNILFLGFV